MKSVDIANNRKEIVSGLYNTYDFYSLSGFIDENSRSALVDDLLEFLDSLTVNLKFFFGDYENLLIALSSLLERQKDVEGFDNKFFHLLKILLAPSPSKGMHGTYSEKMKSLYQKEFSGQVDSCDPAKAVSNYIKRKYIETDINKISSWRVQRFITSWSKNSPLADIRQRLGITKQSERPIKVIVTNKSLEMLRELGTPQFVYYEERESHKTDITIVLTYGINKIKTDPIIKGFLEHEYAHTQSGQRGEGITLGLGGLLFEGLNEAITDSLTTVPLNYKRQREVLDIIIRNNPGIAFKEMIYNSYMGDRPSRISFLSNLVRIYGLEVITMLARMNFRTEILHYPRMKNFADSIFISPEEIIRFLKGFHRNQPYQALVY